MTPSKPGFAQAIKGFVKSGDLRVLLIENLGFDHVRQSEIDKSRWSAEWSDFVLDAQFVAEKSGFRVASVKVKDGTHIRSWRAVASRIILDYEGLALVCVHTDQNLRWLWSSSSLEKRRTKAALAEGVRHLTLEISRDGVAPDGFLTLLSEIDVSGASGNLEVLETISTAFDYYTMGLQSEIDNNVYEALRLTSEGLLSHRSNRLKSNFETLERIRPEVFILLYRLLFILYAEAREIFPVHHPTYYEKYSLEWCRENVTIPFEKSGVLGISKIGTPDGTELWHRCRNTFHLIMTGSHLQGSKPGEFDFRAYYGTIFDDDLHEDLERWEIPNKYMAAVIKQLTRFKEKGGGVYFVDYSSLEIRQIGSIYEKSLEYHLGMGKGDEVRCTVDENDRKSTGSYFTHASLIERLVSDTLGPIIDRIREETGDENPSEFEKRICSLKICDPAMGSGHFLVGVLEHITSAIIDYREKAGALKGTNDERVEIKRTLVRSSIYGVDLNHLAVELAKMSLWLETANSSRPLSFLDAHLKTGNSLVGSWFDSLADPQRSLLGDDIRDHLKEEVTELISMERQEEKKSEDVHQKVHKYIDIRSDDTKYGRLSRLLDAQVVPFFGIEIEDWRTARGLLGHQKKFDDYVNGSNWRKARKIARRNRFLHWELEFPEVFYDLNGKRKENPGFDILITNPPWNKIKVLDKEFFRYRAPEIAEAKTKASRETLIANLKSTNPELLEEYQSSRDDSEDLAGYFRGCGDFALSARGDMDYYPLFFERAMRLVQKNGYVGMITPTGMVTDDGRKELMRDLMNHSRLKSVYDFSNKRKVLFADVEANKRFCLLTVSNTETNRFLMASQLESTLDIYEKGRVYSLSAEDVRKVNPNTMTCPTLRGKRDADIILSVYDRIPILFKEGKKNPWIVENLTMLHMSNDSSMFKTLEDLLKKGFVLRGNIFKKGEKTYLPIYESKNIEHYNHRATTFKGIPPEDRFKIHAGTNDVEESDLKTPSFQTIPRYWISKGDLESTLEKKNVKVGGVRWFLGFRNAISSVADSRSLVACIVPYAGIGNSMPCLIVDNGPPYAVSLLASMNSFILDFIMRQKAGGSNLNFFIFDQLPFLPPFDFEGPAPWSTSERTLDWLLPRVLELTYTSSDLKEFAEDCGYCGPPFKWDSDRRFLIKCELDAAFFILYAISRKDIEYVLESFPIVKTQDEARYGDYRSKKTILEIYDKMSVATSQGKKYKSRLNPPPTNIDITR